MSRNQRKKCTVWSEYALPECNYGREGCLHPAEWAVVPDMVLSCNCHQYSMELEYGFKTRKNEAEIIPIHFLGMSKTGRSVYAGADIP